MAPGRLLDWIGDASGSSSARHLEAFRSLVLAHWALQAWSWRLEPAVAGVPIGAHTFAVSGVVLTACCLLSLGSRGRLACIIALPVALLCAGGLFPFTANHTFLALVCLAAFALLDPKLPEEDALALCALRWLAVIVFCWAGVHKAWYGLYFGGEFLTWMIAHGGERWGEVFGLAVSDVELARLEAYPRYSTEAGPYRAASPLLVVLSNGVWLGEIALGLGMLWRRTRTFAALGAIGLTFGIQLAPREFMFALFYSQLLLLFVPGEWNRRLLVVFLVVYAYLLAVLLGAPGEFFLRRGGTL